jgi:TRAP-type mannitol/chloroaromatic compound transport system permease small subunit
MKFLSALIRTVDKTNDFVGRVLWVGVVLDSIIILYEIICRYIFNSPNVWTNELCQYIFAAYTVLTGGYLMRLGMHINVDILYVHFPPRWQTLSKIITFPFFLLFVGAFLIIAVGFGWESLSKFEHSGSAWDPPIFLVKICVPIGALLLLLQGVAELIRNIQTLISGENVISGSTIEGEKNEH